jgi:hypothetical protein
MAAAGVETVSKNDPVDSDTTQDGRIDDAEKGALAQDVTDESGGASPGAGPELQRWNDSTVNIFRYCGTMYTFILMGMTDSAQGVCVPPSQNRSRTPS